MHSDWRGITKHGCSIAGAGESSYWQIQNFCGQTIQRHDWGPDSGFGGEYTFSAAQMCCTCDGAECDLLQSANTAQAPTAGTTCVECSAGQYSNAVGATECVGQCPGGTYSPPGSVSTDDCVPCAAGRYDHDGDPSSMCQACQAGKFSDLPQALECAGECPPGTHSPPGSVSAQACERCPPGRHDHDSESSSACAECAAGQYSSGSGVVQCSVCDNGAAEWDGHSKCPAGPASTVRVVSVNADRTSGAEEDVVSGSMHLKSSDLVRLTLLYFHHHFALTLNSNLYLSTSLACLPTTESLEPACRRFRSTMAACNMWRSYSLRSTFSPTHIAIFPRSCLPSMRMPTPPAAALLTGRPHAARSSI